MAKTLINGQTITTPYGDTWDAAVLHVDKVGLDYLLQELSMEINIYFNEAARTANKEPIRLGHFVEKDVFLANFDPQLAITTLKSQCEDFALTLTFSGFGLLGDKFE